MLGSKSSQGVGCSSRSDGDGLLSIESPSPDEGDWAALLAEADACCACAAAAAAAARRSLKGSMRSRGPRKDFADPVGERGISWVAQVALMALMVWRDDDVIVVVMRAWGWAGSQTRGES